jgi:hypothetical protein
MLFKFGKWALHFKAAVANWDTRISFVTDLKEFLNSPKFCHMLILLQWSVGWDRGVGP